MIWVIERISKMGPGQKRFFWTGGMLGEWADEYSPDLIVAFASRESAERVVNGVLSEFDVEATAATELIILDSH